MAAGDQTGGRRIADGEWHRVEREAGDYGRVYRYENEEVEGWIWKAVLPSGAEGDLTAHQITEHEDGTITVTPSIQGDSTSGLIIGDGWHGFLERGVWREA
jgi:hypothetical protein